MSPETAIVSIIAIVGTIVFVTTIVKMGLEYNLKIEKIRHGYPLDEIDGGKPAKHRRGGYTERGGFEMDAEPLQ